MLGQHCLAPLPSPQAPAQDVITFHKITPLDEKNVWLTRYSEPSPVDCTPCRNENPSGAAFQTEVNQGSLAILALLCQVLSFSRNPAGFRQIRGEEIRPGSLHNHSQFLGSGTSHLVI